MGEGWREEAWRIVVAAARHAGEADSEPLGLSYALDQETTLLPVDPGHAEAVLAWDSSGWVSTLGIDDPRRAFIDLYLPIASATPERPIVVGHLGQSLDGFIATHAGESRFVTGPENILHLHRLRALCDAVVVGAGTVAADDPQLTTRLVPGPNPLRVVIDPARRLRDHHRVFSDDEAETIYLCAQSLTRPGEQQFGRASIVGLADDEDGEGAVNIGALVEILRARDCRRVFVEGGGVTVSLFLEANLLDRLHVAIAPLIIGDGRPAIRLPARALLDDCQRPRYRVFRMGGDVLFDCDLRHDERDDSSLGSEGPPVVRVI